ncbi:MAG: hypothetical protein QW356_08100 [Candidatus Hadarchaeales archaeon]
MGVFRMRPQSSSYEGIDNWPHITPGAEQYQGAKWFTNVLITPPLENITTENQTVEANFFLPNPFPYFENEFPESPPPEPFDVWIPVSGGWLPAKEVTITFDISENAWDGDYKVQAFFRPTPVSSGGPIAIITDVTCVVNFKISGKAPPSPPTPYILALCLLVVVGGLSVALGYMRKKRKIKI